MNYWLFKSNPKIWSVDDKLNSKNSLVSWSVNRYMDSYKPGDISLIYRTGSEPGIVTSMKFITPNLVAYGFVHDQEFQVCDDPDTPEGVHSLDLTLRNRIIGHVDLDSSFLSVSDMKTNPALSAFAEEISTTGNFSNFKVDSNIGNEILNLIFKKKSGLHESITGETVAVS